jgi:hypothetical protein
VDLVPLEVDMAKEVLLHVASEGTGMISRDPDVLIQIESPAVGEIESGLLVEADEVGIDGSHAATRGQPQHKVWLCSQRLGNGLAGPGRGLAFIGGDVDIHHGSSNLDLGQPPEGTG